MRSIFATVGLCFFITVIASTARGQSGQGVASPNATGYTGNAAVDPAASPSATVVEADAPITAVTVYGGRAAVTRRTTLKFEQGVFAVRFNELPAAIQSDTLQARVEAPARLVNVEYLETPIADVAGSPAMIEITAQIEAAKRARERLSEDQALLVAQRKVIDQIGVRTSTDASRDAGTDRLSIDQLRKQLEFVQSEQSRIVNAGRELAEQIRIADLKLAAIEARRQAMGQGDRVQRSAEVTIAVPNAGEIPMSLTYLVANAGWEPTYNVRATGDRSAVSVEFDANLLQQSGEDWNDVALTISTAQPTMRANPPTITPIFVTVHVPPPASPAPPMPAPGMAMHKSVASPAPAEERGTGFGLGGGGGGGGGGDDDQRNAERLRAELADKLTSWSSGASVVEGGTAVSYELPRRVTVPSNADRKTRTRVATITPTANFVYTALPLFTDAVYLRSRMVNDSPYQLVPGPAQVFMGTEFVGPTRLGGVAPKGEFTVYFGVDRAIRATRTLVSKNTTESGVFSKSRDTTRDYRIVIDNGSARDIELELFDRRPVSQDEKITVAVDALTRPLSTDAEYVRDQLPQGIMRWDLRVPATATGTNAMTLTWTVRLSAPRDLQLTPVPD